MGMPAPLSSRKSTGGSSSSNAKCKMQNAKLQHVILHFAFCILHSFLERNASQLLQRDAQDRSQREAGRESVRDANAGAAQLEKIDGRFAARQNIAEFAREVFAIVGVEMQRLQVVAEVHGAQ